jgi:hypothetical protein
MADEKKKGQDIIPVQKHENIFAALAAFQAENPELKRTKLVEFEAKGRIIKFWYAPLDEVLQAVRPLTAKHGLSITWEEKSEMKMVCAIYHESYVVEQIKLDDKVSKPEETTSVAKLISVEKNVLRSMPITVRRAGDMKDIGSDSTYARRYTLAEVLGVAPDEDTDAPSLQARVEKLENTTMVSARNKIKTSTAVAPLEKQVEVYKKNLAEIAAGKGSALGLTKEQLDELVGLAEKKKAEIEKAPLFADKDKEAPKSEETTVESEGENLWPEKNA